MQERLEYPSMPQYIWDRYLLPSLTIHLWSFYTKTISLQQVFVRLRAVNAIVNLVGQLTQARPLIYASKSEWTQAIQVRYAILYLDPTSDQARIKSTDRDKMRTSLQRT